MEVILRADVSKIGKAGQVVKVKDGYARNFLIPNKLALPVNSSNLKVLEQEKKKKEFEFEKTKKEAESLKEKLASLSLTIPVLTQEDEKLYGSIGTVEIVQALKDEGVEISKAAIDLAEPIKQLGIYEIPIKLHSEISLKLKVWIVKK